MRIGIPSRPGSRPQRLESGGQTRGVRRPPDPPRNLRLTGGKQTHLVENISQRSPRHINGRPLRPIRVGPEKQGGRRPPNPPREVRLTGTESTGTDENHFGTDAINIGVPLWQGALVQPGLVEL